VGNALLPNILRADKVLTPALANETFTRLLEQQKQAGARRYIFDEIVIPFKEGATQATAAAQLQAYINAPRACTVIGRELYVYADDGETFRAGVTGMDDLTVVGAGAGTLAVARDLVTMRQSGYILSAFTGDATTWTLTAGWLVLHVAYDRFEGNTPTAGSLQRVAGFESMNGARLKVNESISALQSMNSDLAAGERQQRIDIIKWGDDDFSSIPAAYQDMPIPTTGGLIGRCELMVVADATRDVILELLDEALGVVGSVTVSGAGSTFLTGDAFDPAEQLSENVCDPSKDYYLRWRLSGSGTVYTAYAMLCWT
jgi:hypothetical protein